jgi:hypothetical protein
MIDAVHLPIVLPVEKYLPTEDYHFRERFGLGLGHSNKVEVNTDLVDHKTIFL